MRVWVGKAARRSLVRTCMECPGLVKCKAGQKNERCASGPIPDECPLRTARKREIEELS